MQGVRRSILRRTQCGVLNDSCLSVPLRSRSSERNRHSDRRAASRRTLELELPVQLTGTFPHHDQTRATRSRHVFVITRIIWASRLASCLKLEPERELNRAWSADLIERAEAAIRATRSQAARERLRRSAEE